MTTTARTLRRRQARRLAARRAEGATTALERMNAAIHLNGLCGEPDCAPEPEPARWPGRPDLHRSTTSTVYGGKPMGSYSLSATVNRLDTSALHAAVASQGPQDDATGVTAAIGAVEAFLTSGAWGNDSASVSLSGSDTYLSASLSRIAAPAPTAGSDGNPNVPQTPASGIVDTPAEGGSQPGAGTTETPTPAAETPAAPDSGASATPASETPAETPAATPPTADNATSGY